MARYCWEGRPEKGWIKGPIKRYYLLLSEISIVHRLLMRDEWLIIPAALQKQILNQIHTGHQGISKCHDRARQSVWWTGLSTELENVINKCRLCCMHQALKQSVKMKVASWNKAVILLSSVALAPPQTAYAAYTHGLRSRWSYLARTTRGIANLHDYVTFVWTCPLMVSHMVPLHWNGMANGYLGEYS